MSQVGAGRKIEDIYPLSPMQQGMLFHSLYAPELSEHINQLSWTISGGLNVEAFEQTWQRVIERHTVLRSSFYWEELENPLQVVSREVELPLARLDWRSISPEEQTVRLEELLKEERERGFELNKAPLLRLVLIRSTEESYHFIWTTHHLLLDGWSMPLLFKEFSAFYEAFSQGQDLYLERTRPFRDYILWLQGQELSRAEAFWRETLKDFQEPVSLPVRNNRPNQEDSQGEQSFALSIEATAAIQSFARQHQLTVNTLVQGAWALLLSRYSGKRDVVFGAVVSGRPGELSGAETMVGNFINTLPVRLQVEPAETVRTYLRRLQERQVETRQYEYSPLYDIQGWSEIPRGVQMFESILAFQNYPVGETIREQSKSLSISNFRAYERSNYQLTVKAVLGRALQLNALYSHRSFDDETIARLLGHFGNALENLVSDHEQPLARINLLSAEERERILVQWNETRTEYPRDLCTHQLFEAQVERTPDAIALNFDDESLSYRELNERANQLAHHLKHLGVGPEVLVGVLLPRTAEMVVSFLAILKAGGAYLPLESAYPAERLNFMLADGGAPVVITKDEWKERVPEGIKAVCLDSQRAAIEEQSRENPAASAMAESLAYLIYTSGSTGTPKGVGVTHRAVNRLVCNTNYLQLKPTDKVAQAANASFDAATFEIWGPLLHGASVIGINKDVALSPQEFALQIREQQVSVLFITAALFNKLASEVPGAFSAVEHLMVGGEALDAGWMRVVLEQGAPARLMNAYGPTESTTFASWYLLKEVKPETISIPIGRPLSNTELYVLDQFLQPVPIGVTGELFIGGDGLARGYHNRPELTAEKFVPHPFSREAGARLYRTGDLVRQLSAGEVDFVGRVDEQVKIRGFRIELGEIEAVLREHSAVSGVVVVARQEAGGEKRLVCYVVPEKESDRNITQLRDYLKQRLPEYMIPSSFIMLDRMPLTPNGKVDRRALPAPDQSRPDLLDSYVAPRNPLEEVLAAIWSEILRLNQVGINDDFFELGGHSLLATQVVSRLREAFRLELPLRSLFENRTIAELAQLVEVQMREETGAPAAPPLSRVSREQALPLSFPQQRLWFLDQLEPGSAAYNIPAAFALKGQLDIQAFERTFDEIFRRHESLRTRFQNVEGKPVQIIAEAEPFKLDLKDLRQLPEAERELTARTLAGEEARTGFNLEQGPLMRVRLLQLGEDEFVVLLTMHHIISDGWSIGVLMGEVAALYQAFSRGEEISLPELPIQYADYAYWQREWLSGPVLEAQLGFWRKQLEGAPVLQLPTDRQRPALQTTNGAAQRLELSKDLTSSLQALSRREGVTLYMTLLAAFQVLLSRYTGQEDIVVGTVIANRNRAEIEGLLGFFINNLALRTDLSGDITFRELLRRVREVTLDAYTHQDVPFELVLETLQVERDLSRTPIFQVLFTLQNTPASANHVSGFQFRRHEIASNTARFDLEFYLAESKEGVGGYLVYNTDLFEVATINRMLDHFQNLLGGIVTQPDQRLMALPLLGDEERHKLLAEWNRTEVEYPAGVSFQQLFEEQVKRTPGNIAVACAGESLTYDELNRRANRLAHFLREQQIGPDAIVPILAERGIELLTAILAVLKAGAAYLPLDPLHPPQRTGQALQGSDFKIVLLTNQFIPLLNEALEHLDTETRPHAASIEDLLQSSHEEEDLPVRSQPGDLAYVLYTSGSTGMPKGVMIEHAGLLNHLYVMNDWLALSEGDAVAQTASQCFDISVWQFLSILLVGGRVEIIPNEVVRDPAWLLQGLTRARITVLEIVPALLQAMMEEIKQSEAGRYDLSALRWLIPTGEALTPQLCRQWLKLFPAIPMLNAYGPAECSDDVSFYPIYEPPDESILHMPIGRPVANTRLYVLDQEREPVPIGVAGELYVGGICVGRGYLNDPQRTGEVFLHDKFAPQADARLYKTGDLARFLPDGNIEFLGRNDYQVKIRGYRIELGEIEIVLSRHSGVRQAVAVALDETNNQKRLVAYVVPEPAASPTVEELLAFLKKSLPEYMVPSALVMLDELPLTANGKINRRALPVPDQFRMAMESTYVAPRNPTEEVLADIYAEVLGLEQVGIDDNFFQIGGHSLLATQVISRLRTAFEIDLPLRRIFEQPTVAGLSILILESQADRAGADELAQILAELNELSDDEALLLLNEEAALNEAVVDAELGE